MLSNAAANALLKTLEEPPGPRDLRAGHHRPPEGARPRSAAGPSTSSSGCSGPTTLASCSRDVRDAGRARLDDDALSVAVRRGRGSARDALSALDQVAASGSADDARPELDEVVEALGERGRRPGAGGGGRADRGRLGAPAAGGRAGRRPAPGVPGRPWPPSSADGRRRRARAAGRPGRPARPAPAGPGHRDARAGPRWTCARPPTPGWCWRWPWCGWPGADLDDSAAALAERVARLERALARATGPRRRRAPPAAGPGPDGDSPARRRPAPRGPAARRRLRRQRRPERRTRTRRPRPPPAAAAAGPRARRDPVDPGRTRPRRRGPGRCPTATPWSRPGATTSCGPPGPGQGPLQRRSLRGGRRRRGLFALPNAGPLRPLRRGPARWSSGARRTISVRRGAACGWWSTGTDGAGRGRRRRTAPRRPPPSRPRRRRGLRPRRPRRA